jgi:hypothetical protein
MRFRRIKRALKHLGCEVNAASNTLFFVKKDGVSGCIRSPKVNIEAPLITELCERVGIDPRLVLNIRAARRAQVIAR